MYHKAIFSFLLILSGYFLEVKSTDITNIPNKKDLFEATRKQDAVNLNRLQQNERLNGLARRNSEYLIEIDNNIQQLGNSGVIVSNQENINIASLRGEIGMFLERRNSALPIPESIAIESNIRDIARELISILFKLRNRRNSSAAQQVPVQQQQQQQQVVDPRRRPQQPLQRIRNCFSKNGRLQCEIQ